VLKLISPHHTGQSIGKEWHLESAYLIIVQFSTPVMSGHFDLEMHYVILKFKLRILNV